MEIDLNNKKIRMIGDIIKQSQHYIKKHGFSVCDISIIENDSKNETIDLLTLAFKLTQTSYMMAKCEARKGLFVHFTTQENSMSIMENGFSTKYNSIDNDYFNSLSCFRVDSMSRGFKTPAIDTAVLFEYTGEYFTCIRQDDVNSNIGYQVINDFKGIEILGTRTFDEFNDMKISGEYETNMKQVMLHHGLPIKYAEEIKTMCYEDLRWELPEIYQRVVNGILKSDVDNQTQEF